MRHDATELAALGLLGLNPALDTVSTVPTKRKASISSSVHHLDGDSHNSASSDSINCICGFTYDDGFSIGCDSCSRWCHAACFGIVETQVPEEWQCWICSPRPTDKDRAVRLQKARQKAALDLDKQKRRASPGVDRKGRRVSVAAIDGGGGGVSGAQNKRRRRPSVNVQHSAEDEHVDIDEPWTHSYVPIDKDIVPHDETREKLRKLAVQWRGVTAIESDSSATPSPSTTPALLTPDTLSSSQVHLQPLGKSSFHPSLSTSVDSSLRPPSYAVRAARPIASSTFITPFASTIIPSTAYLADPLNAYAHLSMPKPFVHLIGPPLDVALDARLAGSQSRFIRSGCRPNAILRPVLCNRGKKTKPAQHTPQNGVGNDEDTLTFGIFALKDLKAQDEVVLGWEWDDGSVIHHLPALIDSPHLFPPRQLQQYRQQLISMMHTLSSTFATCACGSKARDCALTRIAEFIDSGTPPTPSPSPPTSYVPDRVGWTMDVERVGDDEEGVRSAEETRRKKPDLGPLIGVERGFRTRERVPSSGGMTGVEMVPSTSQLCVPPLQERRVSEGSQSSSKRIRMNAHSSGKPPSVSSVARASSVPAYSFLSKAATPMEREADREGKCKEVDVEGSLSAPDIPMIEDKADVPMEINDAEETLPPKLRKGWIRKSYETLRDIYQRDVGDELRSTVSQASVAGAARGALMENHASDIDEDEFDPKQMPPPPLPSRSPHLQISTSSTPTQRNPSNDLQVSPSIPFSNLSLLSPSISGSSPYLPSFSRSPSPSIVRRLEIPLASHVRIAEQPHQKADADLCAHMAETPSSLSFHADTTPTLPSDEGVTAPPSSPAPDLEMGTSTGAAIPAHASWSEEGNVRPATVASDTSQPSPSSGEAHAVTSFAVQTTSSYDRNPLSVTVAKASPAHSPTALTTTPTTDLSERSSLPQPPLPPSKVKLSLKDFALRKRKQREEEMTKAQASPCIVSGPLEPSTRSEATQPSMAKGFMSTEPSSVVHADIPAGSGANPSSQDAKVVSGTLVEGSSSIREIQSVIAALSSLRPDSTFATKSSQEPEQPSLLVAEDKEAGSKSQALDNQQSALASLQAKVEILEHAMPAVTVQPKRSSTPLPPEPPPPSKGNKMTKMDRFLPKGSTPTRDSYQQASQEDGEIFSPPPPKVPAFPQRSRSPPTHPRSFHPGGMSPSHSLPVRRPLHPAPQRATQNTFPPSRPVPSGPRALRALNYSSYPSLPPARTTSGPLPPRGPSADRDRVDWDRERGWSGSSRGRSRGGGWMR